MRKPILVIGAGIVGGAIARQLAKRGAVVTVLEQSTPARGASGGSFGWINANFAGSPAYFALRHAAMEEWRTAQPAGPCIRMQCAGGLWWEWQDGAFDDHHRLLAGYGYPVETIDAAGFAGLEPGIATPPARCLFARTERAVDAGACTEGFLRAAIKHGARLESDCRVTGWLRERTRVCGVHTTRGVMRADTVVVAAGAAAPSLLAAMGIALPMDNRAGLIIHTKPLARVIRHLIFAPEIHFWQRDDGVIVAGETFGGDPGGDPAATADGILRRLRQHLPGADGLQLARIIPATRPIPADGFPVVGGMADFGEPGVYVAVMHSGVTLAPLVGRLAAEEILDGRCAELLAPFRLARFARGQRRATAPGPPLCFPR